MKSTFEEVFSVIEKRKTEIEDEKKSQNSYVISLLLANDEKILGKVREECAEVMETVEKKETQDRLIHEACDLLFHLFILCAKKDISLKQLEKEFEKRQGIGGFEEKRNRKNEEKNAPPK